MRSLVARTSPGVFDSPWVLGSMHRQLENWMDRAFAGPSGDYSEPRFGLTPRIDFAETENGYELSADLPGMDEKNVDVSLVDHVLTIQGERSSEKETKGRNLRLSERSHGSFRRLLNVPEDVDPSAIEARLSNGVLHVQLPRLKDATPSVRRIEVKAK